MLRALEKYDVNVVGLTLSKNQKAYVEQLIAVSDSPRSKRVLLEGWEQFHEPVDRIVAIGPLEHFGYRPLRPISSRWLMTCCRTMARCCCTRSCS